MLGDKDAVICSPPHVIQAHIRPPIDPSGGDTQVDHIFYHFRRSKQSELDCERDKLEKLQRTLERRLLELEGETQCYQDQLMADFDQVSATSKRTMNRSGTLYGNTVVSTASPTHWGVCDGHRNNVHGVVGDT